MDDKIDKRLNNLKIGVIETLKMNGATDDEILQVCNKILMELKGGIK